MKLLSPFGRSIIVPCLAATAALHAANPISTLNYAADLSAHVLGDRLYVYPSHDRKDSSALPIASSKSA